MTMADPIPWNDPVFTEEVSRRSGSAVQACYQCHKCSTGCPTAPEMDLMSSQIIRMINLGDASVLESEAIWLCASCEACTTRCPQGIDIAAVMDALRMMAVERKADLGQKRPRHFSRSFLGSVRRHGRVYEMGLMTAYKFRSGDLMTDVGKFPGMLFKGKLPLLPKSSGNAAEVREIFDKAKREERER